jgi:hypothetical protein
VRLFYGLAPAIFNFHPIFILIVPILLGLAYFVLHRNDWGRLFVWMLACAAAGRVAAYWWLNTRRGRVGALDDEEVWECGGLAGLCLAVMFWKWLRDHTEDSRAAKEN